MVSVHNPGWLQTFDLLRYPSCTGLGHVPQRPTVVLNSSRVTPGPKIGSNTLTTAHWLGSVFPLVKGLVFLLHNRPIRVRAFPASDLRGTEQSPADSPLPTTRKRHVPVPLPTPLTRPLHPGRGRFRSRSLSYTLTSQAPRAKWNCGSTSRAQETAGKRAGLGRVRAHPHCRTQLESLGGHGLDLRQHWEG